MPYVQVWVDAIEVCEPCEECRRREEEEVSAVEEIIREWHFAKSRGDYEHFERLLMRTDSQAWHKAVYGLPQPVPRKSPARGHAHE